MNPIATEDKIRRLELMLSDRSTDGRSVEVVPKTSSNPQFVVERYVITPEGKMSVE